MAMEEEEAGEEVIILPEEDAAGDGIEAEGDGVLLYYKFVQIPEPPKIQRWLYDLSSSLRLLGRIRVAPDGINVTVGGTMTALKEHIKCVDLHPLFGGIDFKLASSVGPVDHRIASECGFTSLSVRLVKELVSLGLHPTVKAPSVSDAGEHVTAQEFHKILQNAARASTDNEPRAGGRSHLSVTNAPDAVVATGLCGHRIVKSSSIGDSPTAALQQLAGTEIYKKTVVLDARNLYETRIGKFCPPASIEIMNPNVRQYSDLPRWIDEHEDYLRNNRILMYCTGGVRCEMASAYIRSKGEEFKDVLQLSGGIQRYLEAFPDGGYFSGKNFVFDHRLAVSSQNRDLLGSCLICCASYSDYSARCRCSLCRMLVLVCPSCQMAASQFDGPKYTCELCRKEKKEKREKPTRQFELHDCRLSERLDSLTCDSSQALACDIKKDDRSRPKLKILCLHGFRQSASSLKGRLNALRKKLRQRVEFVFVDAPHEIPSINLRCPVEESSVTQEPAATSYSQSSEKFSSPQSSSAGDMSSTPTSRVSRKFAWLINPVTVEGAAAGLAMPGRSQNRWSDSVARSNEGISPTSGTTKSPIFRTLGVSSPGDSEAQCTSTSSLSSSLLPLLASYNTLEHSITSGNDEANSESGTIVGGPLQYRTQTEGWSRSWDHLKTVFAELGPFDGVLGFSQGAAVAAALCTQRLSESATAMNFRFVIICSGFCSPAKDLQQRTEAVSGSEGAIDCPSLHIFGGSPGLDRQIGICESERLASLFRSDNRVIVRHSAGHIIPTQPEYVQQYLKFLDQFG